MERITRERVPLSSLRAGGRPVALGPTRQGSQYPVPQFRPGVDGPIPPPEPNEAETFLLDDHGRTTADFNRPPNYNEEQYDPRAEARYAAMTQQPEEYEQDVQAAQGPSADLAVSVFPDGSVMLLAYGEVMAAPAELASPIIQLILQVYHANVVARIGDTLGKYGVRQESRPRAEMQARETSVRPPLRSVPREGGPRNPASEGQASAPSRVYPVRDEEGTQYELPLVYGGAGGAETPAPDARPRSTRRDDAATTSTLRSVRGDLFKPADSLEGRGVAYGGPRGLVAGVRPGEHAAVGINTELGEGGQPPRPKGRRRKAAPKSPQGQAE